MLTVDRPRARLTAQMRGVAAYQEGRQEISPADWEAIVLAAGGVMPEALQVECRGDWWIGYYKATEYEATVA